MDRNYTKTLFRVIVLVLIDVLRKQSRTMSVSLFLFEVLNKYSVAAFRTGRCNSPFATCLFKNQHWDHSMCVGECVWIATLKATC